jgi:hypothetical protein
VGHGWEELGAQGEVPSSLEARRQEVASLWEAGRAALLPEGWLAPWECRQEEEHQQEQDQ